MVLLCSIDVDSGSFLDLSAPPLMFLSLLGDDSKLMDSGLLSGDDVS